MFCQKCGFQNEDNANFCLKCGADLRTFQNVNAGSQQQYNQQANYQQPNSANPYSGNTAYPQNPGNPYPQGGYSAPNYLPAVNSHLALSIVSIFFCFILGIIAIVYSNKSKTSYTMGDYNGALSNAKTAKILAIIGIVLGAFTSLIYIFALSSALA